MEEQKILRLESSIWGAFPREDEAVHAPGLVGVFSQVTGPEVGLTGLILKPLVWLEGYSWITRSVAHGARCWGTCGFHY